MPVTKYIWDEQTYLAESDGADAINVVYTTEPQEFGSLIGSRISGASSYHHFDAIGSTRQLTNAAGAVTDTWINDAWGTAASRTGTTGAHLAWIGALGYYTDAEIGAVYVRRRMYS